MANFGRPLGSGAVVLCLIALGLSSCKPDPGGKVGGANGMIRAEASCDVEGLSKPLRQTIILVDAKAISKVADGEEFATKNVEFRDVVLGIADPAKALASGTSAPRERVTIAVIPSDGSAAQVAFTGCIPGMSANELAQATKDRSTMSSIFSAGPAAALEDQAEEFRKQLIGGLVAAATKADGMPSAQSGPIEASNFLAGMRSSKGLLEANGYIQRLIVFSDIGGLAVPTPAVGTTPHKSGLDAGAKAGGDFNQADLHIIVPQGRPIANAEFLDGYFLAQGARLASYSVGRISNTQSPPTHIWTFAGQAAYPSGPELVEVRIGDDGSGKLAGAWLTVLSDPNAPIPMFGQIICSSPDTCQVASDKSGFAQAWSPSPGGAPEFDNTMPFAGMRNFKFQIGGGRLTGSVYDDRVYLGSDTSKNSIAVTAQAK